MRIGISTAVSRLRPAPGGGGGGGGGGLLWNSADKSSSVTLSSGNLVATKDGTVGEAGVRTTVGHSSGKFVAWMQASGIIGNFGYGVAGAGHSLSTYIGGTSSSAGAYSFNTVFINGGSAGSVANFSTADKIALAIDLTGTTKKLWFKKLGGTWNNTGADPSAGTGHFDITSIAGAAPFYVCCRLYDAGPSLTLFSSEQEPLPSGFTYWGS